jgi:Flp pilus assembly protein CpaB
VGLDGALWLDTAGGGSRFWPPGPDQTETPDESGWRRSGRRLDNGSSKRKKRRCPLRSLSNRLILATACLLLLAGLLWFGGNLYLSRQAQRVEVVAAAVDIPRGTVITAAMLGVAEVPRGTEEAYVRGPGGAVERFAAVDIIAGTPLVPRMLADEPLPQGRVLPAGTVLDPGRRAIAVPLDKLSLAGGALRVGDRVSVYATAPITAGLGLLPPPLAENVRVLDLYTPEGVSLLSRPAGRRADVALLEADPVLADLLVEAVRAGGLRLVLEGETP